MPKLLIATHNAHKTEEIAAMLDGLFEVEDLNAHPDIPPAVEDGDSFSANATIKAMEASTARPDLLVLSDDSGLEVDALNCEPGVYSSRYAGEEATDADNRAKVTELLQAIDLEQSPARFRCVMVLARGGEKLAEFDGKVEGLISVTECGEGGFGYDPMFTPDGFDQTFGELSAEVKNKNSHRANALKKAVVHLRAMAD